MKFVNGEVHFRNCKKDIYPYVSSDISTKVLIIGGGISGLITAYYLAKDKNEIIVVEKNLLGFGQTGANIGTFNYNYLNLLKFLTEEEVKKVVQLYKEAKEDFIKMAEEIGASLSKIDKCAYTNKIMQKGAMQKEIINMKNIWEAEGEIVPKIEEINSTLNISWNEKTVGFNPYEFLCRLAKYLKEKLNVKIYENTEIIDVEAGYSKVKCTTNNNFVIDADKVIFCTGIDFLSNFDENLNIYNRYNLVTNISNNLVGKEKFIYNFCDDTTYIRILENGKIIISGEETKVNMKIQDERYRKELEKEKYTKLLVYLNKVMDIEEYLEVEKCYSNIVCKTVDLLPFIDEIECMPNCFCSVAFGQNSFLSSIIGGKFLRNAINGLFVKEIRFFRIGRESCYKK